MSLQAALSAVAADQIEKKQGKHRPQKKGKGKAARFAAEEKAEGEGPPAALAAALARRKGR